MVTTPLSMTDAQREYPALEGFSGASKLRGAASAASRSSQKSGTALGPRRVQVFEPANSTGLPDDGWVPTPQSITGPLADTALAVATLVSVVMAILVFLFVPPESDPTAQACLAK